MNKTLAILIAIALATPGVAYTRAVPKRTVKAACTVTDGDTIRCGKEHIRISGIDSPEMPGHCAKTRVCAPGDPFAAKANMALFLTSGPITIRRVVKKDKYGRTVGVVYANGVNVSCAQLAGGFAIFKPTWDTGGYIARECHQK